MVAAAAVPVVPVVPVSVVIVSDRPHHQSRDYPRNLFLPHLDRSDYWKRRGYVKELKR